MNHLNQLIDRYPKLISCEKAILEANDLLLQSIRQNNKLLLCGNGGSASDCDHIAGELLKGFGLQRKLNQSEYDKYGYRIADNLQGSIAAIPLPNMTGLVSAYSNDVNAEFVYAQLVHGLGNKGDVLFAISTSGNSKNVLHAVSVAKAKGLKTLGLTGESGGNLRDLCDISICVPETEVFKIQELHLPIYHALCLQIEASLFG